MPMARGIDSDAPASNIHNSANDEERPARCLANRIFRQPDTDHRAEINAA